MTHVAKRWAMPLNAILTFALFAAAPLAQAGGERTQVTEHYKVTLEVGPLSKMLMPGQAKGAKEGEVMVPTIRMTDQATGASRKLDSVMAMYDVKVGMSDLHFGNNVYLADGKYTVVVDNEKTVFKDVAVPGS